MATTKSNSNIKPEKVIVLWGNGNCGKTTTIKIVIDLLKQSGGKETVLQQGKKDVTSVINWNGKTIGICTVGDARTCQEQAYNLLGKNCDVYIFTSRSKGETVKFIFDNFSNTPIIWHEKWSVFKNHFTRTMPSHILDEVNEMQARKIVDLI